MDGWFEMRKLLKRLIGLPMAGDYTAKWIASGKCLRALDIGCGQSSPLSEFRSTIWTAGVNAFEDAVNAARSRALGRRKERFGSDFPCFLFVGTALRLRKGRDFSSK